MWQGRFRSIIVQKEGYLGRLGKYIERNPVSAEIVKCPWNYKWSSAAAYSGFIKEDPLVVLSDHPFRNSMADTEPLRCECYMKYLLSDKETADDMELFSSNRKSMFIGADTFRNSLFQSNGRTSARKKGKPAKA
jgi:putative transposase